MTSPDPKFVEELLLEENFRRKMLNQPPFQYFIPYGFLKRRIAEPSSVEERKAGDNSYFNPKNRAEVAANNELRSALKRYIFIKAGHRELEALLTDKENKTIYQTLWYYRDWAKQKVTVPHPVMEQFINACCDVRINFEIWPALDSLEENDEVIVNTTQFKGYKARVLEVRHDKNGCQLTVGFHLFHGAMLLKLPDLRPQDVIYEKKDARKTVREGNRYKFIEDLQRKLFGILARRTNEETSEKAMRKDAATLEQLYNYRYRSFESDNLRRKFYALMLLCAHLRGDSFGKADLVGKVKNELDIINQRRESKISTDIRAFLYSSLYVATRELAYKEAALEYFGSHGKLSATHKQLMKLIK